MQNKKYDLEERSYNFAKNVRVLVNKLQKTIPNSEDSKQVVRSSGSVGANYIEANENLGPKDFLMRIKICRKEAKESKYWLPLLLSELNKNFNKEIELLIQEATELMFIVSAIMIKVSKSS